jgi:hypothetical protein
MKKIIDSIRKFFKTNDVSICETCGWETNMTETTEKLKDYCGTCGDRKII